MKPKETLLKHLGLLILIVAVSGLSSCKKSNDSTGSPSTLPIVTTAAVTGNIQYTAVCGGTVTNAGSSNLIARGVCINIKINPDTTSRHFKDANATTGSFTVTISGLNPSTTYHVRAYATNSSGISYGADQTFTTTGAIPDGYYIKGVDTTTSIDTRTLMKITKNEVTMQDRSSLLEVYIPLKAGTGFNIVEIAGHQTTVYGPGTGFKTITTGAADEPKVPFQRGPAAITSATFTVPSDGMYHVVFDYSLNIAIVAPVHWEMIGAALPNGWANSTDLTESTFNPTTMSWTISNLVFQTG